MESIQEIFQYYFAAFLFAAGMGLLIFFVSLYSGIYVKAYDSGTRKENVFEERELIGDDCVVQTKAEVIGTILSAPRDVSIFVDGDEISAREINNIPLIEYAKNYDANVLAGNHLLSAAVYEKETVFSADGQVQAVRFTGR